MKAQEPAPHREPVAEDQPPRRSWRRRVRHAGYTVVPYWFAGAAVLLGAASVVQDEPVAGACGAAAGVTAGLLHQGRARRYRRQAVALRQRLRAERAASGARLAELQAALRLTQTEVWELRFAQQASRISAELAAAGVLGQAEKAAIAALATAPMDFTGLRRALASAGSTEPEPADAQVIDLRGLIGAATPPAQNRTPVAG